MWASPTFSTRRKGGLEKGWEQGVGTSHTARPGLGDPGSLIIRHLFNQTFFSRLEKSLSCAGNGWDGEHGEQGSISLLPDPSSSGPDFSSHRPFQLRRQHLPVVTQAVLLEGLTTCTHFRRFIRACLLPYLHGVLENRMIAIPLSLSLLSWPSLQGLETVDLSLDLALCPVRLYLLFRLPC